MPSSPPDLSPPPASPPPAPAAVSEPAAEGDATEKPWYLEGDEDADGWEHTNAKDDAE
jgi:hypothetical protein